MDLALTPAGTGTFVDARFGMEPQNSRMRVFDVIAGKRYFRRWLEQSLDALQRVAHQQAENVPSSGSGGRDSMVAASGAAVAGDDRGLGTRGQQQGNEISGTAASAEALESTKPAD